MGKNRIPDVATLDPGRNGCERPVDSVDGAAVKAEGTDPRTSEGQPGNAGGNNPSPVVQGPRARFIEDLRLRDAKRRVPPPPDDDTEAKAPFLWELLTFDSYADGTNRPLAEIIIRRSSGVYEIGIRDHASRQSKSGACLTLGELVDALEAMLCDPTRPWRPYDSYVNPDPEKNGKKSSQKT